MYQDQDNVYTIRTLACDICERFDSILLTKAELEERVNRNSLHIGSRILSHRDHLRIVYFDIDGNYLGDTMSLNVSDKSFSKIPPKKIPYLLEETNSQSLSFHRKMLRYLRTNEFTITIVGPTLVGKTSLTLFLETGIPERSSKRINHAPTMGQSIKRFKLASNDLTIFDMGGQEDFWHLWKEKINSSDKVLFVVDGTANNLEEARQALTLLFTEISRSVDVLIIINKLDLFLEGYSEFFMDPIELLVDIPIPDYSDYWLVKASVYNGYAYGKHNEEQLMLSEVLTEFFER